MDGKRMIEKASKMDITTNTNTKNPSVFNLEANNKEFKGLDKEQGDNAIYMYEDTVIATDRVDDDKVIILSKEDKEKIENDTVYDYQVDDDKIFKDTVAIVPKETLEKVSGDSKTYNLNNIEDFVELQRTTDMNYNNIDKDTDVVLITGMDNTYGDAQKSQDMIQKDFPNLNVGLINDETGTIPYISDFLKWQTDSLTTRDVLNTHMYNQLSPDTHIITHSAGNEKKYKINKVNELLGVTTSNIHTPVASPRGTSSLERSNEMIGDTSRDQINHKNDPVTIVNKDADYEVDWNNKIPVFDDLIDNHPLKNYYDNEGLKEEIQWIKAVKDAK
jgi:hypothetical protein